MSELAVGRLSLALALEKVFANRPVTEMRRQVGRRSLLDGLVADVRREVTRRLELVLFLLRSVDEQASRSPFATAASSSSTTAPLLVLEIVAKLDRVLQQRFVVAFTRTSLLAFTLRLLPDQPAPDGSVGRSRFQLVGEPTLGTSRAHVTQVISAN